MIHHYCAKLISHEQFDNVTAYAKSISKTVPFMLEIAKLLKTAAQLRMK